MSKKAAKPKNMTELLALLPDTGITSGSESNEAADFVAAHPETWTALVLAKRGRPRRGQETGSKTRSLRFTEEQWALIDAKAKRLNLTSHAASRKALLDWALAPDEVPTALAPRVLPITTPTFSLAQAQSVDAFLSAHSLLTMLASESESKSFVALLDCGQSPSLPNRRL